MKHIIPISVLLLFLFSGNSLFAQAGESKIGFKAGLNLANIHGDDAKNNLMKTGYHVGGFVTIPFGNLAFQPELLISTRGYRLDSDDENVKESFNFMYVDVPLLLKFYATNNLNLHLGPQIGANLSGTYKYKNDKEDIDNSEDVENINVLDLGATAGIEFDSGIGLVVGARYYYGLTNIQEESEITIEINGIESSITEQNDIKNNMIQVYVGIGF